MQPIKHFVAHTFYCVLIYMQKSYLHDSINIRCTMLKNQHKWTYFDVLTYIKLFQSHFVLLYSNMIIIYDMLDEVVLWNLGNFSRITWFHLCVIHILSFAVSWGKSMSTHYSNNNNNVFFDLKLWKKKFYIIAVRTLYVGLHFNVYAVPVAFVIVSRWYTRLPIELSPNNTTLI